MEHERIECTRAQFADMWGVWPQPDAIGVCFVSPDGKSILKEYLFTDRYPSPKFLTRNDLKDIAELERLYKL